jgi:hypothetical protein
MRIKDLKLRLDEFDPEAFVITKEIYGYSVVTELYEAMVKREVADTKYTKDNHNEMVKALVLE